MLAKKATERQRGREGGRILTGFKDEKGGLNRVQFIFYDQENMKT